MGDITKKELEKRLEIVLEEVAKRDQEYWKLMGEKEFFDKIKNHNYQLNNLERYEVWEVIVKLLRNKGIEL
tara:strand:+ start:296 stop:508 length:213 start_codon:yes stop_codon:yes gene_type:complete